MLNSPVSTQIVLWTMRSMIASVIAAAPSLACQSDCLYCVQKMVDTASYQRSMSSKMNRVNSLVIVFAADGDEELVDLLFSDVVDFVPAA